jgi:hypothetical protein
VGPRRAGNEGFQYPFLQGCVWALINRHLNRSASRSRSRLSLTPICLGCGRLRGGLVPEQEVAIRKQIEAWLPDIIEESNAPFSSRPLAVRKKDGTWRICVDYRRVNAATLLKQYPLPRVDSVTANLAKNGVRFSSFDGWSMFQSLAIGDELSKDKLNHLFVVVVEKNPVANREQPMPLSTDTILYASRSNASRLYCRSTANASVRTSFGIINFRTANFRAIIGMWFCYKQSWRFEHRTTHFWQSTEQLSNRSIAQVVHGTNEPVSRRLRQTATTRQTIQQ